MRTFRRWGVVTVALLLVTACGDDADTDDTGTPGLPTPTMGDATPTPELMSPSPTAAPDGGPTTVTASLVDFRIELSQTDFPAGEYTFVVEQDGQMPHALAIEGPGVNEVTGIIEPGGSSEELAMTLEPGTYELWCPVGNHRSMGMQVTIDVR